MIRYLYLLFALLPLLGVAALSAGCSINHSLEVKRHPPAQGGISLFKPDDTGGNDP